jgi:hypothetical protein
MYRCRDCDSTKVTQQVFGMVDVNDSKFDPKDVTWDWDDYYFCEDCEDEAAVYFKEKEE